MKRFVCIVLLVVCPSAVFATLKDAKQAYARKEYEKALKLFQAYNNHRPSSGEGYMYMGYIYEFKKDYAESIKMFKQAVNLSLSRQDKVNSYIKIIFYYNYHQEWQQVSFYAGKLLKLEPGMKNIQKIKDTADEKMNSGYGYSNYSNYTDDQNKPEASDSLEYYEYLYRKTPGNEQVRWRLALMYIKRRDYYKAEPILSGLVRDYPDNLNYLYKYGNLKIREDRYQEALTYLDQLEKKAPKDNDKLLYYANINQAVAHLKLKELEKAAEYYHKAYDHQKTSIALLGLVRVKYEVNDCKNAIEFADKVIVMDPESAESYMYKSLCLFHLKRKKEARKNLETFESYLAKEKAKGEDYSDKYDPGILRLARFYTNEGKFDKAQPYFDEVRSRMSSNREFQFYQGKSYLYQNKPSQAIPYLSSIYNSSGAYLLLAKCYALLDNEVQTETYLKKAAELGADSWNYGLKESEFATLLKKESFRSFLERKGEPESVPDNSSPAASSDNSESKSQNPENSNSKE